jgi:RNA polymerase sigma-70 factor (ECF subfamily)
VKRRSGLAKLLAVLMPDEAEALGLLALLLLQDSRREARTGPTASSSARGSGRALWNRDRIDEGLACLDRALGSVAGPVPAAGRDRRAAHGAADRLGADRGAVRAARAADASPVVELNRAVAVAMAAGPSTASR